MGSLGLTWGSLGPLLGENTHRVETRASFRVGLSWSHLVSLGALLGSLELSWASLGITWASLELSWDSFGSLLSSLGPFLVSLGALLGLSWASLR